MSSEPSSNKYWLKFIIFISLFLGLLLLLNSKYQAFSYDQDKGEIAYRLIILLWLCHYLSSATKWKENLKYLLIWFLIILFGLVIYAYRFELEDVKERVLSDLVPGRGRSINEKQMAFPIQADGHYYINLELDGVPILGMVDTGASDLSLSPEDYKRIGKIEVLGQAEYNTANGRIWSQIGRIHEVSIGNCILNDVKVSINKGPMKHSLVGMSLLKKLKGYEFKNGQFIIYW